MKKKMENFTVNGFVFEYNEDNEFYECRGDVCYDDEHDEVPEPDLWAAARELVAILESRGYPNAEREHSEKGWVEVTL